MSLATTAFGQAVSSELSGLQGSAAKYFQILNIVSAARRPVTLLEINYLLDVSKPSLHRLVKALVNDQLLERDPATRGLVVGPTLIQMSIQSLASTTSLPSRRQLLQDLSDTIGETINFGILDRDEVVYLDRIEARWPLGLRFSSGSRVPCHCTAIGKIMLALLAPSTQKKVINNLNLSRYTSNTITERTMLISALREVKQRQLGIDDQEFMDGVVCVAVPVTLGNGNCVGAIAMSSPEARMDLKAALEFVPLMRQTVRQLAHSIEPDNGRHQPPM